MKSPKNPPKKSPTESSTTSRKSPRTSRKAPAGSSDPAPSRRTARRSRRRARFTWAPPLWISGVLLVLALAVILLVLIRDADRHGWFTLLTTEQQGGSVSTLEEIRELSRLETLSYVQRTVFPHDFLQPHLTVTNLLRKIASSGTTAAEALTPEELVHLRAANLAQSLALATRPGDQDFVVVTTVLILGYDLGRIAEELQDLHLQAESGDTRDSTTAPPRGPVYTLPPPHLLTVMTENINRENYPFPPVFLDAGGWRAVTTFVEDHVVHTAPLEELRRAAAGNGARVLESMLSSDTPRIVVRPFFQDTDG